MPSVCKGCIFCRAEAVELFLDVGSLCYIRTFVLQDVEGHKTVNQYVKLRRLGTGSYGKVVLHKDSNTGKLYAMKILHRWVKYSNQCLLWDLRSCRDLSCGRVLQQSL